VRYEVRDGLENHSLRVPARFNYLILLYGTFGTFCNFAIHNTNVAYKTQKSPEGDYGATCLKDTVVALSFEVLEFGGTAIGSAFPAAAFTLKNEFVLVVSTITLPLTAPAGVFPIIVYGSGTIVGIVEPTYNTTPPSVG